MAPPRTEKNIDTLSNNNGDYSKVTIPCKTYLITSTWSNIPTGPVNGGVSNDLLAVLVVQSTTSTAAAGGGAPTRGGGDSNHWCKHSTVAMITL